MTRIVMKLVTKAKKDCHSLIRPSDKETPDVDGSRRFRTSNVIANANTPSLKASVLAVSFAPRLTLFSMGWIRRHASGRFEGAPEALGKRPSEDRSTVSTQEMVGTGARSRGPPPRRLSRGPSHDIRPSRSGSSGNGRSTH